MSARPARERTLLPARLFGGTASHAARRAVSALAALGLSLAVVLSSVVLPATNAFAADAAALRNTTTASATNVVMGQSFNYVIEVGCSVLTDECVNAVLTDTIPSQFIIGDASTILTTGDITPEERTITVVGQVLTINFQQNLANPSGAKGLKNGIVTITVPVTVRNGLDYTPSPVVIPNTSSIVADNAPAVPGSVNVNLTVPLSLTAGSSKAFSPTANVTSPGVATTLTLGATNTSNTAVDTLVIQDPVTPATNNLFGSTLLMKGPLGTVTWPTGATSATVALWDSSLATPAWVSAAPVAAGGTLVYPASVTLADARGVRITFTSGSSAAIPRNATASFPVSLENRSGLSAGSVSNTAEARVGLASGSATSTSTATYTLQGATTSVSAGKTISPARISTTTYGVNDQRVATVTLTANNTSNIALKSLTVTEPVGYSNPANSASNPLSPDHVGGGLIFQSFGSVIWPNGATGVEIEYTYDDYTTSTSSSSTANTMPAPTGGKRVIGFTTTFTGTITPGATATLPFTTQSNPLQVNERSVLYSNTVRVDGVNIYDGNAAPATSTATVTVLADQLTVSSTKAVTPTSLPAASGQSTTVTLNATLGAYPESTRTAEYIEIVDPQQSGLTDWYSMFNPTQMLNVGVPGGATLTVQYRDSTGAYADIPGFVDLPPLPSAGTYTMPFPSGLLDDIYGLKFQWESAGGFAPGSNFTTNITYTTRSTVRGTSDPLPNPPAGTPLALPNCATAIATANNGGMESNQGDSNCVSVNLNNVPGGGGGGSGGTADILGKRLINTGNTTDQTLITTRNGNSTRVRLNWSTAGFTQVGTMTVYDGPVDGSGNPAPALWNTQKGWWDAYNLTSIPAINSSLDAFMQYDQVVIEVYDKDTSAWVQPFTCTTASPCRGSSSAIGISSGSWDKYVAVRFIFSERLTSGGAFQRTGLNPAPGSGVAASSGNTRNIDLIFQLRNSLRSDASFPVVAGPEYNVSGSPSMLLNAAHARATLTSGDITDAASDSLTLQDPNLQLTFTKSWSGGPMAIPDESTLETAPRPTGRVTLVATNTSPSIVPSLTIAEPNPIPGSDTPFDKFDLLRFQSITHPSGATGLTITVTRTTGGDLVATGTPAAATTTALAWTSTDLQNATGLTLVYTGAIAATTAFANVQFDLTLRTYLRSDPSTRVSAGTVFNSASATVSDKRYDAVAPSTPTSPAFVDAPVTTTGTANVVLSQTSIGITTTKSFGNSTQTEPSTAATTVTLVATPNGSERVKTVTITDDRATFWNAFDYVSKGTLNLPTFSPAVSGSAMVMKTEVCTGRTDLTDAQLALTPDQGCVAGGGTWVSVTALQTEWQNQASLNSSGIILPTGVTASQVQGVRFTIKRADNSQWENASSASVTIQLNVQRRLMTLRSGGPVLTNYPSNPIPPGETVRGVTTNGITSDVLGIWDKTATASNTATYTYAYAPSGVEVRKLPAGAKAPGQLFNYTLQVRNTGSWPIINPVITDYLPSDADGALLIFDPDAAPAYKYALTGSAPVPPRGQALPTGTTGPTVATVMNGPGPSTITFTFPSGVNGPPVLEVGQTYVITVPMMFRPGLTYATSVTNTFGIKGDRIFNTCTAPSGSTASLDGTTGECRTSTTVSPAQQPALRAFMSTKAVVDPSNGFPDQGYTGAADCAAAVDADGFSRLPCVPLTIPGQNEIWRITAQNTGTTEMPRLVLATRLPSPGDKTILDGFLRQSAWTATFVNEITATLAIPGAVFSPYYTTATNPCPSVLQTPSNLNACGSNPATGWAPWTTAVDPLSITGMQFVIDFDAAHYFRPGESITVDILTKTGGTATTAVADPLATNSLSASARSITGVTQTTVTALDYSRVSVGMATGSVTLSKDLTGPAASFVPNGQTFTGQLSCDSLGQTVTRPFTFTMTGGVPTPASIRFDNLPGGATCTATETTASGQTRYTATSVVIDPLITDPAQFPHVQLTNDYQLAGITVSKSVTTTAGAIPTGFHFTASCTFLGQPITLAAGDASFTLNDGGSKTITGLPANASCTIVEDDARGADSAVLTGTTTGSATFTDATRTAVFRLGANGAGDTVSNTLNFDNRFDAPAVITITKKFDGSAAQQFGIDAHDDFTVHVRCQFGSTLPLQYDGNVVLEKANGWKATIDNIIAGSVCVTTEADLQGADAVVITPNDGTDRATGVITVPGAASPSVEVDVTNWYLTGSVEVTKTFAGDAGAITKFGQDAAAEYEVTLTCERDGVAVTIPGGSSRTVTAAAPTVTYTNLASGALCTLSETDSDGASSWRVLNGTTPVVDGEFTISVTTTTLSIADQPQAPLDVENTFRFAQVSATKTVDSTLVDGNGDPLDYGDFELTLTCELAGRTVTALEASTRPIADGATVTWTELPEGADCQIEETDTRLAESTSYRVTTSGGPGPVTTGTTATLEPLRWTGDPTGNGAAFTNTYTEAALRVSKTVTTTATVVPTLFHFEVECEFLGNAIVLKPADASFTLDDTESHLIEGLPPYAECLVTEDDAKGADSTVVTGTTDAANGGVAAFDDATRTAQFTLSPNATLVGATNAATFDNRFGAPAVISIEKKFEGSGAAQFGESRSDFTVHVYCVFGTTLPVQYDADVVLLKSNGWKATIENVIAGSDCEITETDLGGADAVVITPNDGVDEATGTITVPATATTAQVDVTNWYLTGSVEVTKTFAGDAGAIAKFGQDPLAEYEFELVCTRGGDTVVIPGGGIRTVTAASPTALYTELASGADCTLTETGSGGASSWRVLDGGSVVVDGEFTIVVDPTNLDPDDQPQAPLDVENTFRFAELSVAKTVRSPNGVPAGNFRFDLACTFDGRAVTAAEAASQFVAAGASFTWTELPEGADCRITETEARSAASTDYSIMGASGIAGAFVNGMTAVLDPLRWTGDPDPNEVEFRNTYTLAQTGLWFDVRTMVFLPVLLILAGLSLMAWMMLRRRKESLKAIER